jgi:hypothetical protein
MVKDNDLDKSPSPSPEGISTLPSPSPLENEDPKDFVKREYLPEAIQVHVDLMRNGNSPSIRAKSADKLLEIAGVTGRGAEGANQGGLTLSFSLEDVGRLKTGLEKVKEALTDERKGKRKERDVGPKKGSGERGESGGDKLPHSPNPPKER